MTDKNIQDRLELIEKKLDLIVKYIKSSQKLADELMSELGITSIENSSGNNKESKDCSYEIRSMLFDEDDIEKSSVTSTEKCVDLEKLEDGQTEEVDNHSDEGVVSTKAKDKKEFNVPFVDSGTLYKATYAKKGRRMTISVSSGNSCKILKGSQISLKLSNSKGFSRETLDVYYKIMSNSGSILETQSVETAVLLDDILDIKVATAASLLCGRPAQASIFKKLDSGEPYKPTRYNTPKSTAELESYIFNNTK